MPKTQSTRRAPQAPYLRPIIVLDSEDEQDMAKNDAKLNLAKFCNKKPITPSPLQLLKSCLKYCTTSLSNTFLQQLNYLVCHLKQNGFDVTADDVGKVDDLITKNFKHRKTCEYRNLPGQSETFWLCNEKCDSQKRVGTEEEYEVDKIFSPPKGTEAHEFGDIVASFKHWHYFFNCVIEQYCKTHQPVIDIQQNQRSEIHIIISNKLLDLSIPVAVSMNELFETLKKCGDAQKAVARLRRMYILCHPDKHQHSNNKPLLDRANEVFKLLKPIEDQLLCIIKK